MSKVHTSDYNSKLSLTQSYKGTRFNTLAQLVTKSPQPPKTKGVSFQKSSLKLTLQKRARSKAFTLSYLFDLINLDSKLLSSYWQTFYCSGLIKQEGDRLISSYCNQRWCLTCNRIRTAKMINGYKAEIEKLEDAQFLTLTFPNVKAKDLKTSIQEMSRNLQKVRRNLKKTHKHTLRALRKYECTYNAKDNTYNPHYHLIIEGKEQAELVKRLWLKQYPTAKHYAQKYTPVDDNTINELCKYFTKVISKDNDYNPKALDIMFRACKGLRTFQPIGIKKEVSEDIDEIESQNIDWIPPQIENFTYLSGAFDWVSHSGEVLSNYEPTKEDLEVINEGYKHKGIDTKVLSVMPLE